MPDDTRPTFGQALDSAAAGGGDSGAQPGAAPVDNSSAGAASSAAPLDSASPASAATQPGAPEEGGGVTPAVEEWDAAKGPLPFDRHKAILEHTRTKAREEALATLQQEYGWALKLGPQNFQSVVTLANQWASDPISFVLGALDDLSQHPQYAPQLRSHVAKILATRGNGNGNGHAAQDEPEPQPDIVVDGYAWYSAKQQAARDRWLSNRVLAQVRNDLQPLQQDMKERQDRETILAAQEAATKFATDTLSEMRKLPYFTEQKAEIEKVFRAMPAMPDALVGQAIRDAYIHVLVTKVLPTLSQTAKSELLSNLNQKAAASARNPATGQVATTQRPKSFDEALRAADAAGRR